MAKLTTERLEQFIANPLGNSLYRTEQMDMARQLLAYEQAADRPVGKIFRCSGNKTLRWWNDVPEGTVLYAAPVLLKQQSIKLPSTRMWAGAIECYEKNEIIAAIKSAGYEVSND